jgi:acyl-CoA reductase-like NAD-dependent aldehyde dehydrogenase
MPSAHAAHSITWAACAKTDCGTLMRCEREMPHGGMKSSGYGKDMSMYALEDYTVARHVMVKL